MKYIVHKFMFCLESKIRHSTVKMKYIVHKFMFCLESKIRHSTV